MAPIHHQNRVTFVLYVLSLLLATAFGLLLANWVIRPLHQLSDRASEIAQGNWHDPIELERSDAIGQLSRSLATMARQLKESLTTLEQRVEERNQELTQVKSRTAENWPTVTVLPKLRIDDTSTTVIKTRMAAIIARAAAHGVNAV